MHGRSEILLVAGLLLQRLNELAKETCQDRQSLEKNRAEANSLDHKLSALMRTLKEIDKQYS
jgi:hypothetical protein